MPHQYFERADHLDALGDHAAADEQRRFGWLAERVAARDPQMREDAAAARQLVTTPEPTMDEVAPGVWCKRREGNDV